MAPRTTTLDLTRARSRWTAAVGASRTASHKARNAETGRLQEVTSFGANPGALRMLAYAPEDLPGGAPLVVVLHGCSQTAAGYDAHAGWTALANELGFAVVYPEQTRSNNPSGCFNWFQIADASRGLGETRSIREMVETMATRHETDRTRIFVTGLSAGAAMAGEVLADYPEVFSAGALIAGLHCGAAGNMQEAFSAMSGPRARSPEALGDLVRAGSRHTGPWPRVSVWHGAADSTVSPQNADALVSQWLDVHGGRLDAFREDRVDGHRRRIWAVDGRDVVEFVSVSGMGHGTPLDARFGERPGPFMLEAGISSTRRIAAFFGIDAAAARPKSASEQSADIKTSVKSREPVKADRSATANQGLPETARSPRPPLRVALSPQGKGDHPSAAAKASSGAGRTTPSKKADGRLDVAEVINKALRAAGLMK